MKTFGLKTENLQGRIQQFVPDLMLVEQSDHMTKHLEKNIALALWHLPEQTNNVRAFPYQIKEDLLTCTKSHSFIVASSLCVIMILHADCFPGILYNGKCVVCCVKFLLEFSYSLLAVYTHDLCQHIE